jgi:hypothetical protein
VSHQSDSAEQRDAEKLIREAVAAHLGTPLEEATIALERGARTVVDGVAADRSAFVEIFARQGALKGAQKHKVATDALKLVTIRRSWPTARLVIAFADETAANYATTGTWMAEALAAWDVEVFVAEIDDAVRDGIRAAQIRQKMVNPEATPPADAEED